MSKATNSLLEAIHGLIAEDMKARLESGACEAKDWAVIVKFLKDNNIDVSGDRDPDADGAFNDLVRAAQQRIARDAADLN